MVVATINWALLLITESISLLDLCKYANAMLIHTSNYVPCNMWQSGTLSLWLTGKSVGSVKNLSSDSDLKWLCRETIMNEDRAACLRLLSSTSSRVCVSFCWNVLKVCSLSFLSVSPRTRKAYVNWIVPPGVFGNGVHHAVFAVSDPAQSQDFWNPEKATYFQLQLQFFCFLQTASEFAFFFAWFWFIKFYICRTMLGFLSTYQMSDYHFFNESTASWKHLLHLNCNNRELHVQMQLDLFSCCYSKRQVELNHLWPPPFVCSGIISAPLD